VVPKWRPSFFGLKYKKKKKKNQVSAAFLGGLKILFIAFFILMPLLLLWLRHTTKPYAIQLTLSFPKAEDN
jgi:uncharacterized membrane protein YqjE